MSRRWLIATVVGLTGVALLACLALLLISISSPRSTGPGWLSLLNRPSPEELAHEMGTCGATNRPGRDLRILAYHETPRGGQLVLFSVLCPPLAGGQGKQLHFGYALREGSAGAGGMGPATLQPPIRSAVYDGGVVQTETGRYSYIGGRITGDKVARVEVTFADGRTLSDDTADAEFGLIDTGSDGPCELRLLDASGGVVERASLAATAHQDLRDPMASGGGSTAWPGSRATARSCAGQADPTALPSP